MSSEPSTSGARQSNPTEQMDPFQPASQETSASQAESAPQEAQTFQVAAQQQSSGNTLLPPRSASGPGITVIESSLEQDRTQHYGAPPRNRSVVTLDVTSDHHATSQQGAHVRPVSENGRVHLGSDHPYSNRHGSPGRPQTAPVISGGRPRTGETMVQRPRTGDTTVRSPIDYVVPIEERSVIRHSVEERITPTLSHAIKERDKLKQRAKIAKWSMNIAAGMQVFLGSMTTGLAAIGLSGKNFGVATTVLGILATLTGAFLARVRASQEPETSLIRAHDLESFIRDCQAFCLDYGLDTSDMYNQQIGDFRRRFEILLGNLRADDWKTSKSSEGVQQEKANLMKQPLKQFSV